MRFKYTFPIWLALGLGTPLFAQLDSLPATERMTTVELREISVLAPAWAERNAPKAYSTLGKTEIARAYYGQEPSFLLRRTPSVTSYSDAGSGWGYSYFRLRGMDQTRINFTLDGVPLTEPEDQGMYFSNFDDLLHSVRSVQVQRGVGVSTQGTAAYAGSVHLAGPALNGEKAWELSGGYGSFGASRLSAMYRTGGADRWQFYGRASRTEAAGFKEHSDHRGGSVFLQTGRVSDRHLWKITAFAGRQENQMAWLGVADSILRERPRANANTPAERDDFLQSLAKIQHVFTPDASLSVSTSAYHSLVDGNYDFDLNNFLGLPSTDELYNYDFNSNLFGLLSHLRYRTGDWALSGGLHGQYYQRRHVGSERNQGVLYRNVGFKNTVSGFGRLVRDQGDWRFHLETQVRHTQFRYAGSVALAPQRWTFLNAKVAVDRQLGLRSLVYYSLGRTGREPTRNDLFGGNDDLLPDPATGGPLTFVTTPEYVLDHELGFRTRRERWYFAANLFYLSFRDEIVLNGQFGPNGLPLRANVARSFRAGLETEATLRFGTRWSLHHAGAFSRNRIREERFTIQPVLTPPLVLDQRLEYRAGGFEAELGLRYQSASYLDFANEYELAAHTLLNARIAYRWQRLELSLRGLNLTDTSYATNGQLDIYGRPAYHRQAGINWFLSVTYRGA